MRSECLVPPRVIADFSSEALYSNYRAIQALSEGQFILPMIKANAYGHGAAWVGRLLAGLSQLYGLGVATLEEGAELRKELGPKWRRSGILVFSGTHPWTEEKGRFCESYRLIPVLGSQEDWASFVRGGWPSKLRYELKFNTGMNRLGLSMNQISLVRRLLKNKPIEWHPQGILSHLAMGESPDAKLSQLQKKNFLELRKEFSTIFPSAHFHFANSSAIWKGQEWGLHELTDVVRPGISLYGIPPWPGAPTRGLQSVMTLQAQVSEVRLLKPGSRLGYGGAFHVTQQALPVAILSAGYADGILRSLGGNQDPGGFAWLSGRPTRFLGRVSMDLSAVQGFSSTRRGDWAEILGPHVDIWAQSKAARTIPYELLTSLSSRVQRNYGPAGH